MKKLRIALFALGLVVPSLAFARDGGAAKCGGCDDCGCPCCPDCGECPDCPNC
ncbi:MAG: hypothetical protein ACTHU0_22545 [Kofleriaceae bacterium]